MLDQEKEYSGVEDEKKEGSQPGGTILIYNTRERKRMENQTY